MDKQIQPKLQNSILFYSEPLFIKKENLINISQVQSCIKVALGDKPQQKI